MVDLPRPRRGPATPRRSQLGTDGEPPKEAPPDPRGRSARRVVTDGRWIDPTETVDSRPWQRPSHSPASRPSSTARRRSPIGRDAHLRGVLRLPDHPVDHDGRGLPGRGRGRPHEPVGHAAAVPRAGVGALVRVRRRGLRPRRRARHELHRRPGPGAHEGGPPRHQRQAAAGRVPRRRARADQPGPQHPRRPRRRDGRRRHRLGHPVRAQRAGGGRPRGHRAPCRGGDPDAVPRLPGRLPHDPHARERAAARGRAAARLRRRPAAAHPRPVRPGRGAHDGRRAEPGRVHEGPHRPARLH